MYSWTMWVEMDWWNFGFHDWVSYEYSAIKNWIYLWSFVAMWYTEPSRSLVLFTSSAFPEEEPKAVSMLETFGSCCKGWNSIWEEDSKWRCLHLSCFIISRDCIIPIQFMRNSDITPFKIHQYSHCITRSWISWLYIVPFKMFQLSFLVWIW